MSKFVTVTAETFDSYTAARDTAARANSILTDAARAGNEQAMIDAIRTRREATDYLTAQGVLGKQFTRNTTGGITECVAVTNGEAECVAIEGASDFVEYQTVNDLTDRDLFTPVN